MIRVVKSDELDLSLWYSTIQIKKEVKGRGNQFTRI